MAQITHRVWCELPSLSVQEEARLLVWKEKNPGHRLAIDIYKLLREMSSDQDLNLSGLARQFKTATVRIRQELQVLRSQGFVIASIGKYTTWHVQYVPRSVYLRHESFRGSNGIVLSRDYMVTPTLTNRQKSTLLSTLPSYYVAGLYVYLCKLSGTEGRKIKLTELAPILKVRPSTVTEHLRVLHAHDYIYCDYANGIITLKCIEEREELDEEKLITMTGFEELPLPEKAVATSSAKQFLEYWRVLIEAKHKYANTYPQHEFSRDTINKAVASRVMKAYTFEEIQGYITFYALAYTDDQLQVQGRTLAYFEKHLPAIIEQAREASDVYKEKNKYWRVLLQRIGLLSDWGYLFESRTVKAS